MIKENLSLGIDLGIASCGWTLIDWPNIDSPGTILGMGSWCFDVPETSKERTPTNQIRRANRLLRRVIRRRRSRMSELRKLFEQQKLIATRDPEHLKKQKLDPWELRARGLNKLLTGEEFAAALLHIAKRRGFKSNAKRNAGANDASEDGKVRKALALTTEKLARYTTVGEMFARDPEFSNRRRNRTGDYSRVVQRDDLAREVRTLFNEQRRLGNNFATGELQEKYQGITFFQRPLQDSESLVEFCQFEKTEKRAAKYAPSNEQRRFLEKLINVRVIGPREAPRPLNDAERACACSIAGKTQTVTWKALRKAMSLPDETRFNGIKQEDEEHDFGARTGESFHGTAKLRKCLGENIPLPQLDAIAFILTFRETPESIEKGLREAGVTEADIDRLMTSLREREFAKFKGAAHISALAARNLLPHLEAGLGYDKACESVGYNHSQSRFSGYEQVKDRAGFKALLVDLQEAVNNPVARKSLTESMKQVWALVNTYGLPGRIHIELARDVGKSKEERDEIGAGIDKRTREKEKLRDELKALLNIDHVSGDDLLRYELWKQQGGRCLYTDTEIHIQRVCATDNSVQVDHILPWSRFGDDSFHNKTLCLASANQHKRNMTPFEWMGRDEEKWEKFQTAIEGNKALKGLKKRNYLLRNAAEVADKFRSRNLNDTRYATKILLEAVKLLYPQDRRHDCVRARPGSLTAALRKAWGLEGLKKTDGKRIADDRHHALDALVVAATSEGELNKLTKVYQQSEARGEARSLGHVPEPWPGFRNDAIKGMNSVFVARPERRRARGEGHAATIKQVRKSDSKVYTRKAVDKNLTLKDLDRIKDAARNQALVDSLRAWIEAGHPKDAPPKSPKGDVIRNIRVLTTDKPGVAVRGGTADRGDMVRVDLFTKPNKKGKAEYYLVPIYPHQVMDKRKYPVPPNRAIVGGKPESEWPEMDSTYEFLFSLYPRCWVEIADAKGKKKYGYFKNVDSNTGAINLGLHSDVRNTKDGRSIGVKTLSSINKFAVDRLGRRSRIAREVRTWHGEVCISASPPG